ncbi:MAG TPA: hypothetical protein VNW97_03970, partial [Candidatus Saccharimonadales bacterium]|nr:hypothetical protein [Candidatus Saccharimonadales bacterium]
SNRDLGLEVSGVKKSRANSFVADPASVEFPERKQVSPQALEGQLPRKIGKFSVPYFTSLQAC